MIPEESMKGLILEGIPGAGKTVLLNHLLPRLTNVHRGPLWIATEHITERVLEPLRTTTAEETSKHLRSHLLHLDQLQAWSKSAPPGKNTSPIFILERFHLSAAVHIADISPSFSSFDEALQTYETTLVWCRIPPNKILQKSVRETIATRNPHWLAFLQTLGKTETEIASHFLEEQNQFEHFFQESHLPKQSLEIDPSNLTTHLSHLISILELSS